MSPSTAIRVAVYGYRSLHSLSITLSLMSSLSNLVGQSISHSSASRWSLWDKSLARSLASTRSHSWTRMAGFITMLTRVFPRSTWESEVATSCSKTMGRRLNDRIPWWGHLLKHRARKIGSTALPYCRELTAQKWIASKETALWARLRNDIYYITSLLNIHI